MSLLPTGRERRSRRRDAFGKWQWRRQLLQFATAFSVLPPDDHDKSLKHKPIKVCSVPPDAEGGSPLNTPTASTCVRELYVPEYPSIDAMKERFELAFKHMSTSGFQYA